MGRLASSASSRPAPGRSSPRAASRAPWASTGRPATSRTACWRRSATAFDTSQTPLRGADQEAAGLVHQAVRRQREPRQHPARRGHLGRDAARGRARRHAAALPLSAAPDARSASAAPAHDAPPRPPRPDRLEPRAGALPGLGRGRSSTRPAAPRRATSVARSRGAASSSSSPATSLRARETAELRPRGARRRAAVRRRPAPRRDAPRRVGDAPLHRRSCARSRRVAALPRAPGDVPLPRRREPRGAAAPRARLPARLRARRPHGAARHARRQHPPRALLPRGPRHRRVPRHQDGERRRRRGRDRRPRGAHRRLPGRRAAEALRAVWLAASGSGELGRVAERPCGILRPRADCSLVFAAHRGHDTARRPDADAPGRLRTTPLPGEPGYPTGSAEAPAIETAAPAPGKLKQRVIPDPPEMDQTKGRRAFSSSSSWCW